MFHHIHINDNLIFAAAFAHIHIRFREEPKRANAFRSLTDFARVIGITLCGAETLTDHPVKRGGVAFDIDALHKHTWTTDQSKLQIQGQIFSVAANARLNSQEINALTHRETLQLGHFAVNQSRVVNATGFQFQLGLEQIGVSFGHFASDRDVTKAELLAFGHVNHQEHAVALWGQFSIGAVDAEVHIAARLVEIAQNLFVKFDTVLNQRVLVDKGTQIARLFGFQHPAQTAVRIFAVAHK